MCWQMKPAGLNADREEDEVGSEFEFSDDDAEAVFQRMAPQEVSTSQPQAATQRPGRGHASVIGR